MTNINTGGPAYPCETYTPMGSPAGPSMGITKREVAAIAAMQGMLANDWQHPINAAKAAVEYADALIAALGAGQ